MPTPDFLKKNPILTFFVCAVIIILILIQLPKIRQAAINGENARDAAAVSLITISDYKKTSSITLDSGLVESISQADLRSQFSAPVESVNVALGDRVAKGQILVSLKNDDLTAQLDQAKAGLVSSQASLQTAENGARPQELEISKTQARQAALSLEAALRDSYAKADDSVRNHIDKFFLNPSSSSPDFLIIINSEGTTIRYGAIGNEQAALAEAKRVEMEKRLNSWQQDLASMDGSADLSNHILTAASNLEFLIDFLNDLSPLANAITANNGAEKQVLDGYKSELSAARSAAAGSLASLLGSETSWKLAVQSLDLMKAGSTKEQLIQAKAMVAQAAASVEALEAQVEKTVIRTPIAGTISYLDARLGEVAAFGQLVASIINPGALQIKTYASIEDLPNIAINDRVEIGDGRAVGYVYRISPAIDPALKKAEAIVIVDKNSADSPIVAGQTVNLSIESKKSGSKTLYLLPIQAVKTNGASYVYAASGENTVVSIPVTVGNLVGETIEVWGDFNADQKIISSVMGIAPGNKVIISEQ
ncbi:MAG TPA: HlyD family efflux transporter periplasmic adaptor subunit [Candidatus Paceibacterota bacterium]|nr:HlyD family efflux transporter periplasmic adaptor subunit [Candidatus Pacearchaeota archaeon]HRZ50467.1 HlyD family efflux transporter periplasmic adaptor subunit [Candidatus Paceibacterota bacterium]HSA36188.1 HlyD family efflux transporter periplasmic adaptor subunit [Candidatus Paceibacterota bacterium]